MKYEVVIIGGNYAGLSAAWSLACARQMLFRLFKSYIGTLIDRL